MIRSAPSCWAASTAEQADRAVTDDGDGLARPASAATAPNQPVPRTSEAASRLGTRSSVGNLGSGDQGAVGQRDPHPLRLRAAGAPGSRCTQEVW